MRTFLAFAMTGGNVLYTSEMQTHVNLLKKMKVFPDIDQKI